MVPEAILKEAASVASSLLPEKSSSRYEPNGVTEDVLLAYMNQLWARFSPNSLWTKWSMLKSCLEIKESVQIRRFQKVIAFLKRKNKRYIPRKAKVLSKEQVERFRLDAPDDLWLLAKIVTIFGIFGCCRCDELLSLAMNDVEDMGKYVIVTLRQTKNLTTRRFTITDDGCSFQPCTHGKCISLNAGHHTIGAVPKQIAKFLGLKEPELYTGHCFRRTGATMVVDAGGDILSLKREGGWKLSEIAMSYVDDSINNKIEIVYKCSPLSSASAASTSGDDSISTISSSKFYITGNYNCTMDRAKNVTSISITNVKYGLPISDNFEVVAALLLQTVMSSIGGVIPEKPLFISVRVRVLDLTCAEMTCVVLFRRLRAPHPVSASPINAFMSRKHELSTRGGAGLKSMPCSLIIKIDLRRESRRILQVI
ncbi:hypothetical protein NQ315_014036 [Exocentrus adspersus]|uniref:Tyr recombinase domain-containing protein n=1 Tax=Exocentrus adspersus TaxID=1586481 RepID=A0AAV8VW72_9CUCU|nr:hypothetical protein NQ315_014036 [Exocentrus adspersus]